MDTKECVDCKKEFPKTEEYFYRKNRGVGRRTKGWSSRCRPCWKVYMQQYNDRQRKNKSNVNSQMSRYRTKARGRASQIVTASKQRAKKKGLDHSLTVDWVTERIEGKTCPLTGLPFDLTPPGGKPGPYSPSIDRIDNSKGYTPDNCRIVLWSLNAFFNSWGQDVFASIAIAYLRRRVEGAK